MLKIKLVTMNLHDAIVQVLKKVGTPLSCQDIADIINKKQLYKNIHICLKLIEQINQCLFLYLDC